MRSPVLTWKCSGMHEKEIIMMSSYFLPGRVFRRNMSRAFRRGVKIKLILAGKSDITIAKAGRAVYVPMVIQKRH